MTAEAVNPVLRGVHDNRDHEKCEHCPRAQAPSVGTHLPCFSETMAAPMVNQMKTTAYRYFQAPPTGPKKVLNRGKRDDRERPADPDRVGDPVDDRVDGRQRASEGQPGPDIRAAFLRERRAELGDRQPVRQEEEDPEKDQPGETLGPVARDSTDGVDASPPCRSGRRQCRSGGNSAAVFSSPCSAYRRLEDRLIRFNLGHITPPVIPVTSNQRGRSTATLRRHDI